MTTAPPETDIATAAPEPRIDIYRYGWRYVRNVSLHGAVEYEQVPLTLEDLLYPRLWRLMSAGGSG